MKIIFLTMSVLCANLALGASLEVKMKSLSYDPKTVELSTNDTVTWKNVALTEHSATAEDQSFDTGLIEPGKTSKAVSFKTAGTYKYHCSVHGKTMSGILNVKASSK